MLAWIFGSVLPCNDPCNDVPCKTHHNPRVQSQASTSVCPHARRFCLPASPESRTSDLLRMLAQSGLRPADESDLLTRRH